MPAKGERAAKESRFAAAAQCLAEGDSAGFRRLGLSERYIPHLRQLSIGQLVDLARHGVELPAYLKDLACPVDDHALRSALIQHDAPRELMTQLFGMTRRTYAAERVRHGLPDYRGRPALVGVGNQLEHRVWRLWVVFAQPHDPAQLRQPDHWLLIGLELPNQLRTAWALIQRWAREDIARKAFIGDQARLSAAQLMQAEKQIREKHLSEIVQCNPHGIVKDVKMKSK